MDFEKPELKMSLKKLTNHLKTQNKIDKIENLTRIKKNLIYWKLKNKQFFYESKSKFN